jgi:transcriptional regulator MraZ
MGGGGLFSGSALRSVGEDGAMMLPPFVLRALRARGESRELLLGWHEVDPCVSGYDEDHSASLFADIERRRLREEAGGASAAAHYSRARRTFGAVERAAFDHRGRILLPPIVRRRGGIRAQALVIGTGGAFEIWDPDAARESGDVTLRELAELALRNPPENQGDEE